MKADGDAIPVRLRIVRTIGKFEIRLDMGWDCETHQSAERLRGTAASKLIDLEN
ncbi:hypothetical protein LBMAG52_32290 [Planctomycetia bacterium]|nr:hypothetical protein LBMAG52_32290 [Planctomycetia bacterium]